MDVEIITIGNELLDGRVANTNAIFLSIELRKFLGAELRLIGLMTRQVTTVRDVVPEIVECLQLAWKRAQILLITGGLGPITADVTTQAIAQFFGVELAFQESAYQAMQQRFASRGIPMPECNRKQAYIPQNTQILPNLHGTAPGFYYHQQDHFLAAMPGVPSEMKAMFTNLVLPYLMQHFGSNPWISRKWRTTGIAESKIFDDLKPLDWLSSDVYLSPLSSPMGIDLEIRFPPASSQPQMANILSRIEQVVGPFTYTRDSADDLETVIAKALIQRHQTLAVAESCTGGMVSNRLTNVPGSSAFFQQGIIAYSNDAKITQLNVPQSILERFGAVSAECALAMAQGIRARAGTNIGLATTGIAGPTGETPLKPLGLVYLGYSDGHQNAVSQFIFKDERLIHKQRASQAALALLWKQIQS